MKVKLLGFAIAVGISTAAWGQPDYSSGSREAAGFLNQIRRDSSAGRFKDDAVNRATTVNVGFGVSSVGFRQFSPSSNSSATAPPRSQSASFGISASTPTSKPFASVNTQPTISPYMGLFNEGFGEFNDLDYQTVVRPAIQQRDFNQQVVRQTQAINRRVNALAARNAYNTTGNQGVMPTGHAATFNNHSRFYPRARR